MNFKLTEDKKGTDKIISVYWFAILFIVAGAIIYIVASFYGEPYDVREIEANILINKVADCIANKGYLNAEKTDLENCDLNFNVENFKNWNNDQYFLEVNYYEFDTTNKFLDTISEGNINLKENCDKKEKNFPVCITRNFYTLEKIGEEDKQREIQILSIVRKTEKNVN